MLAHFADEESVRRSLARFCAAAQNRVGAKPMKRKGSADEEI